MYQQIADDLRGKIRTGALSPGQQLPTELDLRQEYSASRNTIRDAIKRLTSLGLVETKPGQGTFVVRKITPFVTTLSADPKSGASGGEGTAFFKEAKLLHREPQASVPRVEVQVPDREISTRLRIEPGAQVVLRHQELFIDNTPWSLQTSFYPFEFVVSGKAPKLLMAEDIGSGGVVGYLEQTMGIKQVGYRDWITARAANPNEQQFFSVPHDATVFEIFRTAFDQSAKPLRVTVTVYPADRNQFIMDFGNVPDPHYVRPAPEHEGASLPRRPGR
jgi:GntR family transcriptional regulator